MSNPILDSLRILSSQDPASWADRMVKLALVPNAGIALRASMPGWRDVAPDATETRIMRSQPDAHPDDTIRCFENDTFATRVAIIARNGVMGCVATHRCGGSASCLDLRAPEWVAQSLPEALRA